MASGIPQVAHSKPATPNPGRNLPLASLSAECYAHLARSNTRPAMSRAKRSPERLLLRWWDSPPSNCCGDDGSPLGAGDPPDYSMFQERAPGALVIGEEHFTFLGYHSNRWCQGPREILSAVNRGASQDSCPVATVSPSRCPRTTQQRIEEQPESLGTVTAKTLLESDFS